jgi:YrbI family 3-deoxy-D-manno-octulosonate 8-phosphate phosphatase
MVTRPEVLAIIPARGGSKGIPRKNIRKFAGYPLLAYSIAAGLQAERVTRVIVSTDDEEIAAAARQWGAETPFMRPDVFAQDSSLDLPVFQHALSWLAEKESYHPDIVVQLRPTSPVRPRRLVDDAVSLLFDNPEADSVRGVVPSGQNPHKMWRINPQTKQMIPLLDVEGVTEPYNAPRQALPLTYWQTGHIDAIRPNVILAQGSMSGQVILPLVVEGRYTVDIDNPPDWQRSEWLVRHGGLNMVIPGNQRRSLPAIIKQLVLDFDGVLTDNRVWVDQNGKESVAAYRSDSDGIKRLAMAGIKTIVLSSEVNPVVAARSQKMGIPAIHGVKDKATVLQKYLQDEGVDGSQVVYLGNDINDIPCFPLVGCALVVADALPEALLAADIVLEKRGGYGVVRELCELILSQIDHSDLD